MRRKRMLTTMLCAVLAAASYSVGGCSDSCVLRVSAAESMETGLYLENRENQAEHNTEQIESRTETEDRDEGKESETQGQTPPEVQESESREAESDSGLQESDTGKQTEQTEQTETQAPAESESQSESHFPSMTEEETETESAGETNNRSDRKPENVTEKETETETETESELSNEELIARQKIVIPPDVEKEFRFSKLEERYAIVSNRDGAEILEGKGETYRTVGVLKYYGLCYILEDQGDGWYYVESGNVRGFLRSDCVVTDEAAERIIKIKGMKQLPEARMTVARNENTAFTYSHFTVREVLAVKKYAIASEELAIYEQRKDTSRVVGTLVQDGLCYILAEEDEDWVFVESDDARGFVKKDLLISGSDAEQQVEEHGEDSYALADVLVKPEENNSCYHTLNSVKEASQAAKTRDAIVKFALQFVGNPYVWGGTSLTAGADCSGFVQSVYSYFGYSLPRVAEDQAGYGMQIPIDRAVPGDLIFYAKKGHVYHVSMYIGDGQVVQAANKRVGIITSGIGADAVWATRIIQD